MVAVTKDNLSSHLNNFQSGDDMDPWTFFVTTEKEGKPNGHKGKTGLRHSTMLLISVSMFQLFACRSGPEHSIPHSVKSAQLL